MVKGISRQVIVVQSPDPKLFEQAIFILRDDAIPNGGVTEDMLLSHAKQLINRDTAERQKPWFYGPVWGVCGAALCWVMWCIAMIL